MSWRKQKKYKTFSVPGKKEIIKTDKEENESVKTILSKIKFIHIARFMGSSLTNLVDNLIEGIHKIKYKDFDCILEYEIVKHNFIKYKCLSCSKDYSNKLDKEIKKKFKNTFNFSNNDINTFFYQLRKDVNRYYLKSSK